MCGDPCGLKRKHDCCCRWATSSNPQGSCITKKPPDDPYRCGQTSSNIKKSNGRFYAVQAGQEEQQQKLGQRGHLLRRMSINRASSWKLWGIYLPSTASSPTELCPGAPFLCHILSVTNGQTSGASFYSCHLFSKSHLYTEHTPWHMNVLSSLSALAV